MCHKKGFCKAKHHPELGNCFKIWQFWGAGGFEIGSIGPSSKTRAPLLNRIITFLETTQSVDLDPFITPIFQIITPQDLYSQLKINFSLRPGITSPRRCVNEALTIRSSFTDSSVKGNSLRTMRLYSFNYRGYSAPRPLLNASG